MKITKNENKITINGEADLTFTRRNVAFTFDVPGNFPTEVTGFIFCFLNRKTRIGRMIQVIKAAWKFTK